MANVMNRVITALLLALLCVAGASPLSAAAMPSVASEAHAAFPHVTTGPLLAYWQSRDSNYNIAISGGGIGTPTLILAVDTTNFYSGTTPTNGTSVDCPAGSTIVFFIWTQANTNVTTVVGSDMNTYTVYQSTQDASVGVSAVAYSINTIHDTPIGSTFTPAAPAGWNPIGAYCISGANGGLDISTSTSSDGYPGSLSLSSGTLAQASEILFGMATFYAGPHSAYTESASFTNLSGTSPGTQKAAVGYDIVSATTNVTWNPSWTGGEAYGAILVSLKH